MSDVLSPEFLHHVVFESFGVSAREAFDITTIEDFAIFRKSVGKVLLSGGSAGFLESIAFCGGSVAIRAGAPGGVTRLKTVVARRLFVQSVLESAIFVVFGVFGSVEVAEGLAILEEATEVGARHTTGNVAFATLGGMFVGPALGALTYG